MVKESPSTTTLNVPAGFWIACGRSLRPSALVRNAASLQTRSRFGFSSQMIS